MASLLTVLFGQLQRRGGWAMVKKWSNKKTKVYVAENKASKTDDERFYAVV